MYETVRSQLPPELAEAIDRAAAETTTDDVTLEGLKASVDGDVDIDKDAWTSKLNEALGDLGETQEVTADHVKIKVDQGDCLWEIGNALGIDWQTIAEQNGIESPYIIHPDQELTISMDTLTAEVDGDKAQAAIEQAMSALDAEGAEMSVTAEGVKVDLADVEVDSDTAAAQIEAALGMESGTLAANGIEVQAGASVAFDGQGSTDPTESDIHYFNLLKAWNKSGSIDFRFTNSHEKTYQVRDSSSKATLFNRLETRLSASKNFLLIISDKTNYDRGILNWEIEKAVDYYELPIIIAYPGYSKIGAPSELNSMWTKSLAERIKNERAHCIHIPFKKEPIFDAINQFSVVNSKYPKGGALGCYSEEAYKSWGIV